MNRLFDIKYNVTVMSEAARFVTGTVAVVDGGFNVNSM